MVNKTHVDVPNESVTIYDAYTIFVFLFVNDRILCGTSSIDRFYDLGRKN